MRIIKYFAVGKGRQIIKKLYIVIINLQFKLFNYKPTNKSCVVFAPHQDDETLGCGGTIIQKKRQGAIVKIVFMTDGNNSHKHMFPDDLRDIRRTEAISACNILGIDEQDIIFLDNEDGKLTVNIDSVISQVSDILEKTLPEEIYIPYIGDHHPDHKATNRAVIGAIKRVGITTTVFEYATWFWDHWPIVEVKIRRKKDFISHLRKTSIRSLFQVLRDLRCSVLVHDTLDIKRNALYQHESQLSRMNNNDKWFILGDVSNGDWLERFFQDREVFHRHTFIGNKSSI